jgi:hypothetical protein
VLGVHLLTDEDSPLRKLRWLGLSLLLSTVGCGITPRTFRGMIHPDGVGRARDLALGGAANGPHTIPTLIARLDDPDPVVQLTANEELKRVTGQDFGFAAWLDAAERTAAAERWRAWWQQSGGVAEEPR